VTTCWRVSHPGILSKLLCLAVPPWVGGMSIGDGFGHLWGRNGESYAVVGTVTRTAGFC